ncbi:MAG: DUF2079 domain-containing protein [Chloroflexi bacterium]|nr:DUF2079 domain-containing protein [Chloroflexota bacterium]
MKTDKRIETAAIRHPLFVLRPAPCAIYLLTALFIIFFSWLSIMRHETYRSAAMDLGYTDQVVWNTLHGRFMQFSTYENAPIDLPLDRFRRTDILLAYHAELLLAPISLLYLIYDSPVTLLVLQAAVIGMGALPAYWLARKRLRSAFAGLVFALAYLLAPAVQGAILSDFHAVSLTASLLLFAFFFVEERRYKLFFAFIVIAMLAKEDVPLLVAMLGLYLFFWRRERKVGALTVALGLGWFLVCTQVILPYYSGLARSPFFDRLAIFGPTAADSVRRALREPALVLEWLRQPAIMAYGRGLLASGGFMSVFSPLILAIGSPVLVINVFSKWDWTYSEGAHYSASLAPLVIVSAIYGVEWLARQLVRVGGPRGRAVVNALALLVLASSGFHHWQIGMTPLARDFRWPQITAHHRLAQEFIALIPPEASLSAQSNLYPHVAHRERAYLFPAVNDAEYIFLDVTGSTYPIGAQDFKREVDWLLQASQFEVVDARDGYLLLKRRSSSGTRTELPAAFFTFAQAGGSSIPHPLRARFGDVLELVGYDVEIMNEVSAQQLPARVTTYWRALRPLNPGYGFAFFFTRMDGAIVGTYTEGTATALFYPVTTWRVGEVVRVETPSLPIGRLRDVLVAVTLPQADAGAVAGRLRPVVVVEGQSREVFQEDSLLKLFELHSP